MRILLTSIIISLLSFNVFAQEPIDDLMSKSDAGDMEATFEAATMYYNGSGVIQDADKAIALYKKAAENGYYPAGLALGRHYSSERVFKIDMDYTKEMLMLASSDPEGGEHVMEAAYFLAQIIIGEKGSNREIYKWLELAADNGHPDAAADVGYQYFSGQKLNKDPRKAYKYSGMAARRGHGASQYNYAVMHNQGAGTRKDNVKALTWFIVAANSDTRFDNGTVEQFENGLTASQVAKAKSDAQDIIRRISN